jgi:hypothetical protein
VNEVLSRAGGGDGADFVAVGDVGLGALTGVELVEFFAEGMRGDRRRL